MNERAYMAGTNNYVLQMRRLNDQPIIAYPKSI